MTHNPYIPPLPCGGYYNVHATDYRQIYMHKHVWLLYGIFLGIMMAILKRNKRKMSLLKIVGFFFTEHSKFYPTIKCKMFLELQLKLLGNGSGVCIFFKTVSLNFKDTPHTPT